MSRTKKSIVATIFISILFLSSGCTASEGTDILQEDYSHYTQDSPIEATPNISVDEDISEEDNTSYLCECGMPFVSIQHSPLNIKDISIHSDFLDIFETIHTTTYLQWETEFYSTLAFWSDEPLRNFTFLSLGFNEYNERMSFYTQEVPLTIEELLPTDVIILNVAFIHYLIPRGGITFKDESGMQWRIFIQDVSVRGGCELCFHSFILSPHDETHFADWTDTTCNINQVIEDFLYPLHTIFSSGHSRDSGALISYELSTDKWFNRYGEQIEPPSFFQDSSIPIGFSLYDFDSGGIPYLLLHIAGLGFGGPAFPMMYRFIDGSYEPAIWLGRTPAFFRDRDGRVIVHYNVDYGGHYAYYHLIFTDDSVEKELIARPNWGDMDSWWLHHQYPYWWQNPTIYGMPDENLTPILPLTELENHITEAIRSRHGLSD